MEVESLDLSDFGLAEIKVSEIEDVDFKNKIIETLMEVIDPELNIDIVNLGLIYEIELGDNKNINIKMTLTAMGCPLAGAISEQVKVVLNQLPEINNTIVDIVWSPPWDKSRVSRIAAIQLGVR